MTTEGPATLCSRRKGSADPGAVLAWDDDRGSAANARIVRKLAAGRVPAVRVGLGLMSFSNPELDGLVRTLS